VERAFTVARSPPLKSTGGRDAKADRLAISRHGGEERLREAERRQQDRVFFHVLCKMAVLPAIEPGAREYVLEGLAGVAWVSEDTAQQQEADVALLRAAGRDHSMLQGRLTLAEVEAEVERLLRSWDEDAACG
jgi:hypothetical protein